MAKATSEYVLKGVKRLVERFQPGAFLPSDYQSIEPKLAKVINEDSRENVSNTPDFILARFMARCLKAFEQATAERERTK